MGLFDAFKQMQKSRLERRIAKSLAVIKNPKAIRDDRWLAIQFFKELDDRETAVDALLARFDYSIEHGIQDTREKEACMEGILRWGEAALPQVREKLRTTTRIAWPIKILKQLGTDEVVVEALKESLNFGDVSFDQAQVDKNYDVLCYLRDYKVPGYAKKLAHFLEDHDERVRFACVELLIEQDDPEIPAMLERFLPDASAENTRIRRAVIDAFLKHRWPVSNRALFPEGVVMDGIVLSSQGHLEARG